VKPRATLPAVAPQPIRQPPPATEPPESRESRKGVRVSIKTSVRDPMLLVVRRLDDGKELPPGTREGWLVMPEATNVDAAPQGGKSAR
jgi:hypothetical protein